jgi:hypothetical protein
MTSTARIRLLLLAPVAWIPLALVHPMGGDDAYSVLHDKVALWTGIHFAQLVLALGVAALLWLLLEGRSTMAARVARVALPIYLVTFSAFDGITGIGSGMAVHHANSTTGPARAGAADTAQYLLTNRFSADLSPLHLTATAALLVAIVGTALALRHDGVRRAAWLPLAFGVLLATHAGAATAVGAACIVLGAWHATTSERASLTQRSEVRFAG